MKTNRWFTRNRLSSHLRIATVGTLISAAAAMAFVAANNSSLTLLSGESAGKGEAKVQARWARSDAFMRHFQTLLGPARTKDAEQSASDGAAQEAYDNRAYPNKWIHAAQRQAAANAASAVGKLSGSTSATFAIQANWQELGPSGVPASALVAGESTGGTAATIFSGRTTAIAVVPTCTPSSCTVFIGAAGGGVWKTSNALASSPSWSPASNGIESNAIGSIVFDPNDATGKTLYVGTGEPNGSGDSEAGVGLYKSTDFGNNWTLVAGSASVATGRSIGAIAIDPADANHIFIGTDVARHGSSSVNGGRFTPPGEPQVGLYESTNGGATFTRVLSKPSDIPDPGTVNGADFFRGGVSHIELYRPSGETQVYASLFDYGVFRRSTTLDHDTAFHRVFASAGGGLIATSSVSRTEFSLAPNGANLRVYVGDTGGAPADFYRVNNANVPAATLVTGGTNGGWTKLSSPVNGTPGFASYNYCSTQCTYDMPVFSPPGAPDIVYIGSSMQYSELGGRSNGRAIQRSEDAGVNFTDMTIDTQGVSLHPDQHAIAATPFDPNKVFIANDGGVWRLNGSFSNVSSQCSSRGLTGDDLTDCQNWLSKVPTTISTLNRSLGTLQFQSLSVNSQDPLADIMGGTQDNGTQAFSSENVNKPWFVTIFGDGGQSGVNAFDANKRFHTFFSASPDVNFHGTNSKGWDWIGDPLFLVEAQSFYIPIIYDPAVDGTILAGLDFVWRTTDNGGNQTDLDTHCNELTGDFTITCGDWVRIGQGSSPLDATKALGDGSFWGSKGPVGSFVVATERAPSDEGTLWVGTRRGRVFVTSNADAAAPGAVTFFRIDTAAQPERFVSGIDVDASHPNHVFVSYSGYNAYAIASGTAPGHVFEVNYDPSTHVATWSPDLAGGEPSAGGLGDQPITGIAVDWNTDDVYVSTDFGVFVRKSDQTTWQPAAGGLPPVATYGLTIDVNARVLYAATHGRGAWRLQLP
ncbi:MAG: hypothetical protein DME36_05600 [Verrucomicrobia bacterium]|nr:MAG: hypothetical protein DME36_05600 [Verrucomicrobiota bacterium]